MEWKFLQAIVGVWSLNWAKAYREGPSLIVNLMQLWCQYYQMRLREAESTTKQMQNSNGDAPQKA